MFRAVLLMGVVLGCSANEHRFTFDVYAELTPEITEVLTDGSSVEIKQDGAVRSVTVSEDFESYAAAKTAPPLALEFKAGSATAYMGESVAGECERSCVPGVVSGCPTTKTIISELVQVPVGRDYGPFEYRCIDCSGPQDTVVMCPGQ